MKPELPPCKDTESNFRFRACQRPFEGHFGPAYPLRGPAERKLLFGPDSGFMEFVSRETHGCLEIRESPLLVA